MSVATIRSALYTWIKRETGFAEGKVIQANQGKPRPALPFAEFRFLGPATRVGSIDELRADEEVFSQAGTRTSLVSINVYGRGANEILSALRDSLDRPDVVEEFAAANIAHISEAGPNDLTALEDSEYIERSQMDLTLSFPIEIETDVGYIESVEITVEDVPVEGTFTVNES